MFDLPEITYAFLQQCEASRSGPHGDDAETAALLVEHGYPCHAAVLAFERQYGGIQLFESDPDTASLVVGPYACIAPFPVIDRSHHERDLVPVMLGWDDFCYYLDARGQGWTCAAMVEGISRPCADNGRQLLVQAILWRKLSVMGCSPVEGLAGESLATKLSLEPIAHATCAHYERWWGDLERLVVEIEWGNGYAGPMTFVLE